MTLYMAALLADRVGNGGADGKPIDALRATRVADSSAASIMETTRAASKYMRAPHLDSEHQQSAAGSLPERVVTFPLNVDCVGDQGQVAERLRIVAQKHPRPRIDLF